MATQAERSATTRGRILDAATSLFVADGYESTTIADILDVAQVSKGALYHHFDSKRSIAEVVFSQVSSDAIDAASRRAAAVSDPVDALISGCLCWLDEVAEPTVATVMFEVGPTALGWERCRELEASNSLRALRLGLSRAADGAGRLTGRADLAAHAINAVLAELAILTASRGSTVTDEGDAEAVVRAVVIALLQIDSPSS